MEMRARWIAVVPLLASFAAGSGFAQSGKSLQAILSQERSRMEQTDVRGSGRLVAVAASGARTNNNITIESHWFPAGSGEAAGLRTLVVVDMPAKGTVRYLLAMEPSGRTSIEVLRRGESAPRRLAQEQWGEEVAGTLFYPEDFFDGQFFWTHQSLLPEQKYGARPCYVLKSEPGAGQFSQYSSVTTYLDQKSGAPVFVEAAGRNGAPTRQFVFFDLEQNGGVWNARQVEVKMSGRGGSSLLLIDHGSPHAHLQRKDFSLTSKPTRSKPSTS
ncbi:MAG TPA: outer membrane lipoprotein-sorting protein [Acidobacteriaceae bacterium]|jgi:hypothetical protein|nr:outer membrane lipoprotein-sorting protein [Acidobacteriaceae bacterium]